MNNCVRTAGEAKNARFFILDDGTPAPDVSPVLEYLALAGRPAEMLNLKDLARRLQINCDAYLRSLQPTCVVGVGEGGTQFLRYLSADLDLMPTDIRFIRWSRLWTEGKGVGFQSDLESHTWKGHRVLLAEDVIASGETLKELSRSIAALGGEAVGVLVGAILGSSPWLHRPPIPTLVGIVANALDEPDSDLDPHWFPPFFSFRHLFFGDREIEDFYERLSVAYFGGDLSLGPLVRSMRDGYKIG